MLTNQIDQVNRSVTSAANHRTALVDLAIAASVALAWIPLASVVVPVLRQSRGFTAAMMMAGVQFGAEGIAPLLILLVRHEHFSDYGFTVRSILKSIAFALLFAIIYDAAISMYSHEIRWIPLRRQPAVRFSLSSRFPFNALGVAASVSVWGVLEAFYGVFFAKKFSLILARRLSGWIAPGVLAFALFNGLLHVAVGQGLYGFLTSFATGYAIAVIPAVTRNAWGSTLFQTLTNAVGKL